MLKKWVRELIEYREVLYMICWRDIRIKYKQSVMGFMWALFMPMLIICAGVVVKVGMAMLSGKPFDVTQVATVSVKALPWSFFISSIRFGANSLIGNANLVTKIYFPKEIFPISSALSQLFDFMIASVALTVILALSRIGVSVYLLWVPLLLMVLILLAIGLSTFLSAANLFFRDVKYLVEVIVTMAIFFTPVFYEAELAGKYAWLLMLNPVAPILEGLNACIVQQRSPALDWVFYSLIVALITFTTSFLFFKKVEPQFAESI